MGMAFLPTQHPFDSHLFLILLADFSLNLEPLSIYWARMLHRVFAKQEKCNLPVTLWVRWLWRPCAACSECETVLPTWSPPKALHRACTRSRHGARLAPFLPPGSSLQPLEWEYSSVCPSFPGSSEPCICFLLQQIAAVTNYNKLSGLKQHTFINF